MTKSILPGGEAGPGGGIKPKMGAEKWGKDVQVPTMVLHEDVYVKVHTSMRIFAPHSCECLTNQPFHACSNISTGWHPCFCLDMNSQCSADQASKHASILATQIKFLTYCSCQSISKQSLKALKQLWPLALGHLTSKKALPVLLHRGEVFLTSEPSRLQMLPWLCQSFGLQLLVKWHLKRALRGLTHNSVDSWQMFLTCELLQPHMLSIWSSHV